MAGGLSWGKGAPSRLLTGLLFLPFYQFFVPSENGHWEPFGGRKGHLWEFWGRLIYTPFFSPRALISQQVCDVKGALLRRGNWGREKKARGVGATWPRPPRERNMLEAYPNQIPALEPLDPAGRSKLGDPQKIAGFLLRDLGGFPSGGNDQGEGDAVGFLHSSWCEEIAVCNPRERYFKSDRSCSARWSIFSSLKILQNGYKREPL